MSRSILSKVLSYGKQITQFSDGTRVACCRHDRRISQQSAKYSFGAEPNYFGKLTKMSTNQHNGLRPMSCDTFVVLPPASANGCIIFGKNSDRMDDEVQEVVYVGAEDHQLGTSVQCTYIEIPQVKHTHAVVLSKPSWMWGAEMGANEHGVCIGNEAVWTKLNGPEDSKEKLLGMDLLRLALERAHTAELAVQVLGCLISLYGQGGNCADKDYSFTYHNSFLVADHKQAYVLESLGNHWAVERVTSGYRNISNQLTIRTKIDKMSDELRDVAIQKGWWKPDQEFDFAKIFSSNFEETELKAGEEPSSRQLWGSYLLQQYSEGGSFKAQDMMSVLRHEDSGICMNGSFTSTGSQVSILPPPDSGAPCVHFFTATANPQQSLYKPFVFTGNASIGDKTTSPTFGDKDPAKVIPRFQSEVDRRHALWKAHENFQALLNKNDPKGAMLLTQIREMESHSLQDLQDIVVQGKLDDKASAKLAQMFQHMVDLEMNFYKMF